MALTKWCTPQLLELSESVRKAVRDFPAGFGNQDAANAARAAFREWSSKYHVDGSTPAACLAKMVGATTYDDDVDMPLLGHSLYGKGHYGPLDLDLITKFIGPPPSLSSSGHSARVAADLESTEWAFEAGGPTRPFLPIPPIGANPARETRGEFLNRAAEHWEARAARLESFGFKRMSEPRDLAIHCEWIARYQIGVESFASIATHRPYPDHAASTVDRKTVEEAVKRAAPLLRLNLRPRGKGGRPRKRG